MDEFETVLYSSDFKHPVDGYGRYIDVGAFIDYHLMTEMPKNSDGYYHSTFMSKDRNSKLALGPVWDFNLSMGNFGSGELSTAVGWYYPIRPQNGTHRWFARLFEDFEFRLKTADRWFELRETVFSNTKLLDDIDRYAMRRSMVPAPSRGVRRIMASFRASANRNEWARVFRVALIQY